MRTWYNLLLYQRIVMALVALTMTLVVLAKGRQTGNVSGLTALSSTGSHGSFVQISGDVVHPGIYEITDKKMTNSVIQMASPLCREVADTAATPLSTRLHVGEELFITCKGPENRLFTQVAPMKPSHCLTLGMLLDLNLMHEADFELLPDVGPVLAKRIVQHRHKNGGYRSVEELLQVEGVGEKKFQTLSHYFKSPI